MFLRIIDCDKYSNYRIIFNSPSSITYNPAKLGKVNISPCKVKIRITILSIRPIKLSFCLVFVCSSSPFLLHCSLLYPYLCVDHLLTFYLFICLFVCLFAFHACIHPSIHPPTHPSFCSFIQFFCICLFIKHLFIHIVIISLKMLLTSQQSFQTYYVESYIQSCP